MQKFPLSSLALFTIPQTPLNRATKITRPCSWTSKYKNQVNPEDEYDESREYPRLEIEFADDPVRNLDKSCYLTDNILYEYSVYISKFTKSKYDNVLHGFDADKRYWAGI